MSDHNPKRSFKAQSLQLRCTQTAGDPRQKEATRLPHKAHRAAKEVQSNHGQVRCRQGQNQAPLRHLRPTQGHHRHRAAAGHCARVRDSRGRP